MIKLLNLCLRSRLLRASVEHGEQDVHPGVHRSQEEVRRVHSRRGVSSHQVLHRQRGSRRPRQSLRMTFDLRPKLLPRTRSPSGRRGLMIRAGLVLEGKRTHRCPSPRDASVPPPNTSSVQPHRKLGASHTSVVLRSLIFLSLFLSWRERECVTLSDFSPFKRRAFCFKQSDSLRSSPAREMNLAGVLNSPNTSNYRELLRQTSF